MNKSLSEVLKKHKKQQAKEKLAAGEAYENNGLIFAWEDGTPISPNTAGKRFEKIMKSCSDISKRTMHDLRHSFASIAISKGMSIKTISAILGHQNIQETLGTYGHLLPGDMEAVMDEIEAFYQ